MTDTLASSPKTISPEPSPSAGKQYGRVASRGMMWVLLQSTYSRVISLLAQYLLGWWLSAGDWAIYGVAIAFVAIVNTFRDGGLPRILVQRGREYSSLASPVFQLALVANILAAALLVAIAPAAARFYDLPQLTQLLFVAALAIPLSTPAMIFQAKLQIDLRFGGIVRIQSVSLFLQYAGMVTFAALGFGPLSFVLPSVATAIFESIAFGLAAGLPSTRKRLRWPLARSLLRASGWIMFATLATALLNQGEHLVIGGLRMEVLGMFVFGFQIAASFGNMLGVGMRSVLMPTLTHISDQPERFGRGFLHSVRMLMLLAAPACMLVAIAAGPAVHLLWKGKWDESIPVVQLLTLALAFRVLTPMAMAALEATGRWSLNAWILWIDAITTLTATFIGCLLGGVFPIALCVAAARAIMAIVHCTVAAKATGVRRRDMLLAMTPAVAIAAAAAAIGGLGYLAVRLILPGAADWLCAVVAAAIFSIAYTAGVWLLMRQHVLDLMNVFKSLAKRKAPPPQPLPTTP